MPETLNHNTAKIILREAWQNCESLVIDDSIMQELNEILKHDHKTFRYILLNGILAKCTNHNVDPIALQAGAAIMGAFDARSLCHKVLVPFEQEFMDDRLGGSNEPFLNKPARFKTLSRENAVRGGKDKSTLLNIILLFQSISFKNNPKLYLLHALNIIKSFSPNKIVWKPKDYSELISQKRLHDVFEQLLQQPFEGASLVFSSLIVLEANRMSNKCPINVLSNPLNQSGSSKNEICDIDIKSDDDEFLIGYEIKDKDFIEVDILHAVNKVKLNNGNKMVFLYRHTGQYKGEKSFDELIGDELEEGFDLSILDFARFSSGTTLMTSNIQKLDLINVINSHIDNMKPSKTFVNYMSNVVNFL